MVILQNIGLVLHSYNMFFGLNSVQCIPLLAISYNISSLIPSSGVNSDIITTIICFAYRIMLLCRLYYVNLSTHNNISQILQYNFDPNTQYVFKQHNPSNTNNQRMDVKLIRTLASDTTCKGAGMLNSCTIQ
jgi:hypothetical protein